MPGLREETTDALSRAVAALPGGGEARLGQVDMARAVASAIADERHLVVKAGTGTGKSLAYLVPAIVSEKRVMVATATKALQDQLAGKDLPFLAEQLDIPFSYAVLKGRSNYVCRQRLHELESAGDQLSLEVGHRVDDEQLAVILDWAESTTTGDRAELPIEPTPATWNAVSVGPRECPGRSRCPQGDACFAEAARDAAAAADVCVVNLHLYGLHLAAESGILPEHQVVVIDEAHQLEDIVAAAAGFEITPGRLRALTRVTRAILVDGGLADRVDDAADELAVALGALARNPRRRHRSRRPRRCGDRPGAGDMPGSGGAPAQRAHERARRRPARHRAPQDPLPSSGARPPRRPPIGHDP